MMCKLDCPCLSPYLFVCLSGWPVGIRAQPDLANTRGFCWEPGGSHPALFREIVDCYPYKIAPATCPDLTPGFAPGFACHPSDLVTRFGLLYAYRGFSVSFAQPLSRPSLSNPEEMINECFSFDVSSLCDPHVLFIRALSQPVLSDMGALFTAGIRFEVSGHVLSPGRDSVWPRLNLLVSGDASDGGRLLVTTSTYTLTGGLMCCDW